MERNLDRKLELKIIQQCIAVAGWSEIRGHAALEKNRKTFDRADGNVKGMIKELIKICKEVG